jgi:hypothetical protein
MAEKKRNSQKEKEATKKVPSKETIQPPPQPPQKKPPRGYNYGNLFLGTFIVLVGFVLLGQSTGLYHINLDIWQLWPLLIIAIGLSLLSRGSWVAALITALVTILVLAIIGTVILINAVSGEGGTFQSRAPTFEHFSIERELGVKSALIKVQTGVGRLTIDGGSKRLVSGTFRSSFLRLDTQSEVKSGVQQVTLKTVGSLRRFGRRTNELEFSINSFIPVQLVVESGAIDMDIDLSKVNAELVDIDTGASRLNLVMGNEATYSKVNIGAGASSINIDLPGTVGARVVIDSGLSSKDLVGFKKVNSKTYETENYNTALKKVEINLDVGVSSVTIEHH